MSSLDYIFYEVDAGYSIVSDGLGEKIEFSWQINGKDADFAVVDKDFNVYMTVSEGHIVYKK